MFSIHKVPIFLLVIVFLLTACWGESKASSTPAIATAPLYPTTTPNRVFPTPSSPKDVVTWEKLDMTLEQLEFTQEYVTDYGSSRVPPNGQKFLWIHVRLKNTAQTEMDVPSAEHFSILYAAVELKPTYGHRQNYKDYTTLGSTLFPAQELDGWLRFDIPATAQLSDLRFVFLPESSQVGTSYNSPIYPYSEDKPTFVWNCTP